MYRDVTIIGAPDLIKTLRRYSIKDQCTIFDMYFKDIPLDDAFEVTAIEHIMILDLLYRYRLARQGKALDYFVLEVLPPFVKTVAWRDITE